MSGPILVLGGTGLLGHAVCGELARRGRAFVAPLRAELDLADLASTAQRLPSYRPATIVNLAGFTDVAAAERPESRVPAIRLNVELPAALASTAARLAIPFVHISTDYVFDGTAAVPYAEDATVNPVQVYGRTKLDGERAVLLGHPRALILRVSTLYGPGRPRRVAYVDAILAQARDRAALGGGMLEVVEPPVSSPTYAPDVAPALLDLLEGGVTGMVHVVNEGAASRLELARAVVDLAGFGDRVAVRTRTEDKGALARPAYSVLDTSRLGRLIGRRLPPWRDGLARYLGQAVES